MVNNKPNHLNYQDTVNYGSYYTPQKLVDIVYKMILSNVGNISNYNIVDTSCGMGSFVSSKNFIGADIDAKAIEIAKANHKNLTFFNHNSLNNVTRKDYNLHKKDKVIIVGNPPYNDTTSIIRNSIKQNNFNIDDDLKSRDLGISFLLSFNKLEADFICVLHPLSYLIKKTNFISLGDFTKNYILKDNLIISSGEFYGASRITQFPIIIAFYEKNIAGMDYNFITNYHFKTIDGKQWFLKQFDTILQYINKYPNQNKVDKKDAVANFYTLRDINALKRTKSFIAKESCNTIRVIKEKFAYYCYVDVFKEYIRHVPYYFGNNEIMINEPEFQKIKDAFVQQSLNKHEFIKYTGNTTTSNTKNQVLINNYFKKLLGEHYVN